MINIEYIKMLVPICASIFYYGHKFYHKCTERFDTMKKSSQCHSEENVVK